MSRHQDKRMIVGLDIGTSKIVAIVAEVDIEGNVEIIGFGSYPSRGLKKGVVVNIESTVQSIRRAVEEAELMAGCQIHSVYAGIAGSHIRSLNSHGVVMVKDREVTHDDIERVLETASAYNMPGEQKLLHVLPKEFVIDGQYGIKEPIGMSGVRMEAKVHLVTGAESAVQNIVKCVERCGMDVDDVILEQLASSYSVLTEDEKELGVCLVDIGGGTTDIAIFVGGAIQHTAVIPIAGDQVTNDVAVALRARTQDAEDIKKRYGCTLRQLAKPEESIEVPGIADRKPTRLSRMTLVDVIQPRYEELMQLIQAELRQSGYENLIASGIVLTGGSSKIEGLPELAEEIFDMPVRLGLPRHVTGLVDVVSNPIHATGVGLLLFGAKSQKEMVENESEPTGGFKDVLSRMKSWFKGNF